MVWRLPPLNSLPPALYAQNLPSILVSLDLHPAPNSSLLDMCASPGGKTAHLASIMANSGTIIALDKNSKKVDLLRENMSKLGATNVYAFVKNSAKACSPNGVGLQEFILSEGAAQLAPATFDHILLDPPCGAFGQRPDLEKHEKMVDFSEYASYQKVLFRQAMLLLKSGGTMVYSTCSMSLQENELLIVQMMEEFPGMELCPLQSNREHGSIGLAVPGLTDAQRKCMRRFWPTETIGFFSVKIRKQ